MSLVGILHHEIWLDEAHHWLLARDSANLQELIYNTRYEGHPILWNVLLYYIARFTKNPFWMQFLHIIISTATIYIFVKKAPFPLIFKALFIFGYFMFFEYNLLSRNYILGILFLFMAMVFYEKRKQTFFVFTLFLVLASNIHLLFLIISTIIFVFGVLEKWKDEKIFSCKNSISYALFSLGIIIAAIQIIPAADSVFFDNINNLSILNRLKIGFISVWNGLITLPNYRTIHFWNTNFLMNFGMPVIVFFGLLIYFLPLFIFNKNKRILLFVYTSILGAQIFFFITQRGTTRSYGMIYIIFIIALWMMQQKPATKIQLNIIKKQTLKSVLIYSILIIHFFSGIVAYSKDFKNTFSPVKNVFIYLEEQHLNKKDIITTFCNAPLSSYLQKKIFVLCTNEYDSYCHWNINCNTSEVKKGNLLNHLKKQNKTSIFITLDSVFKHKNIEVKLLKKYPKSIIKNRRYHIFEINYKE